MRRWSSIALSLCLLSTATLAQSPPPRDPTGAMPQFIRFADIFGGRLVAAFDSIPASRYGYRPVPTQQTIGYIAQHLENANYNLCERIGARFGVKHSRTAKDQLPDTVKARWPKDTLVARLDSSLRFCDDVLLRLGPLDSSAVAANLLAFETDLAEHYSQISVYMRLIGLVPPSALPAKQRTAIALPASTLSQLVGRYQLSPGWELTFTQSGDALFVRSSLGGDSLRVWPESATSFFVKEADAQITVKRAASGAVTAIVVHQFNRDRTATRVASAKP